MATAAATPLPASADFSTDLDSTFSSSPETGTAVAEPAESSPTPEVVQEPPTLDQPPAEDAPPKEGADEVPPFELEDEIGEPKIVEFKGKKEWHFPEPKGRRLVEADQFVRELRTAIPDVSVEGVKAAIDAQTAVRMMTNDFLHGEVGNVANHFANLALKANPEALVGFSEHIVNHLAQNNPQAFDQVIARPVVQNYIQQRQTQAIQQLQDAKASGNQERINTANALLFAAQQESYNLTRRYMTPDDIGVEDPLASEREKLAAQQQQIDNFKKNQQQQQVQQWANGFEKDRTSKVNEKVNAALDRVKGQFVGREPLLEAVKTHVLQSVKAKVEGDEAFMQRFQLDRQQAFRTQSANDRSAALNGYVRRAEAIINADLAKLVTASTHAVVDAANQQHAARAAAAGQREPGGGAPVKKSIVPSPNDVGNVVDFKRELDEAFR